MKRLKECTVHFILQQPTEKYVTYCTLISVQKTNLVVEGAENSACFDILWTNLHTAAYILIRSFSL